MTQPLPLFRRAAATLTAIALASSAALAESPAPEKTLEDMEKQLQELDESIRRLKMISNPHKPLGDAVCAALKKEQYVFLGDTNHGVPQIRTAAFSREVLQAIRDCGTDAAFVLEGPPGTDKDIDALAVDILEDIGTDNQSETLKRAHKNLPVVAGALKMNTLGISRAYYDPGYAVLDKEKYREVFDILTASYDENGCANIKLIYNIKARATDPRAFWPALEQLFNNRLSVDNQPVADAIRRDYPHGVTILYGMGHYSENNDLNEMTAPDNNIRIDIFGTRADLTGREGQSDLDKLYVGPQTYADTPDKVYIADEQMLIDYDDLTVKPYMTKIKMTEAEFNACKAALPNKIKNAFTGDAGGPDFGYADYRLLMDTSKPELPAIIRGWGRAAPQP